MLEIYPGLTSSFSKCPFCGCQLSTPKDLFFAGKYILADILCSCCDVEYFHSYPAKDKTDPTSIAFSKDLKKLSYGSEPFKWNAKLLAHSLETVKTKPFLFKVEQRKKCSIVTLCNLIYNSEKDVKLALEKLRSISDSKLILLISQKNQQLIDFDLAEIWTVDVHNSQINSSIHGLDKWIKEQFRRFEKVYLNTDGTINKSSIPTQAKFQFMITKIFSLIK